MATTITCAPKDLGDNVSRTVRVLMAYHDLDVASLSGSVGMTPDTFYRRLKSGAWSLTEVARIAGYFSINDLDRMALGQVNPSTTSIAHADNCMNSIAMTFVAA